MSNYICKIKENVFEIFDFPPNNFELKLLCYSVNENIINPFLIFMMEKKEDNILNFPRLTFTCDENIDIQDKISELISEKYTYHGIIQNRNYYYAVVELKEFNNMEKNNNTYNNTNNYYFALATEIINYKKIYNYQISTEIINLFMDNPAFYLLIDKNTNYPYKLPDVGYKYINKDEENYYLNFGSKKEKIFESCDEYYFFNKSINNLLRHVTIVRYALFTGNKIYYENENEFMLNDYEINKLLENDKYKTIIICYLNENINYPDILVLNYNNFIPLSSIQIN